MRVTFLYVVFAVPLKLAFALARGDAAQSRHARPADLSRDLLSAVAARRVSVAIAVLWRQLFAGDGLINQALALFGIQGPSWISNPRLCALDAGGAARLAVRLADDHLPRRPAADSAGRL